MFRRIKTREEDLDSLTLTPFCPLMPCKIIIVTVDMVLHVLCK